LRNLLSTTDALSLPYRSSDFARRLREKIASTKADVVYFDGYPMAQYGQSGHPLPQVICPRDCASLLLEKDLQARLGVNPKRLLLRWELRKRRHREARYHRFQASFFVSRNDARRAKELSPGAHIVWAPNGVDTDYFAPAGGKLQPHTVTFTGAMSYGPNVEAALWFAKHVWPILTQQYPEARFAIVGSNPDRKIRDLAGADKGIVVTGYVDDIRPYLDQSGAVIVPMQSGTGIKNKVLEAMAMARPVVATPIALEGIEQAKNGVHCLVAQRPEEFADRVTTLWANPQKGDAMGKEAREMTLRLYSWRTTQDFCVRLLEEAAKNPGLPRVQEV
jgi:glycosyltransferase involved in cell wall biosynthesis